MKIQVNDVYSSDKHTVQISKNSQIPCVNGSFSKSLEEFSNNPTETEKVSETIFHLSNLQVKADGVSEEKDLGIGGYLQFSFIASDLAANEEKEVVPESHQASVDLRFAGCVSASENKSKSAAQMLIPSGYTGTILQETNALADLTKQQPYSLPVSDDYAYDIQDTKPIDSAGAQMIQLQPSVGKHYSDLGPLGISVVSKQEILNVKELSGKLEQYVSGQKTGGDTVLESITRPGAAEIFAQKLDLPEVFQQEKQIVLDYADSLKPYEIDAQRKLSSNAANDPISLVLGEVLNQSSEAMSASQKGFSGKDTGRALVHEHTNLLMTGEVKSLEEIHTNTDEQSEKIPIGLKQELEPVFTHTQQDSGNQTSYGYLKGEQLSEQGGMERPENSFRSVLAQTTNASESVLHLTDSIEKLTAKTDVLIQLAERLTVMTTEGKTEMEVQIHPESLGKVLLRIVNENGVYSARITAETFQVKELIQSHLSDLKSALKEQGFSFLNLDVNLSNSQSNNQQWAWRDRFFFGQSGNGNSNYAKRDQLVERVTRTFNGSKSLGRIDCLV